MKMGKWAHLLLAAAALLAGCKGFWDAPSSTSFTLSNGGNMSVTQGASGTSTITVTPGSSFTGTVSLSCAVTSSPSGATSPAQCSLSSSSLTFSSSTAQTSTLTAATSSSTTEGTYNITVTGTSGSASQTTSLCAQVGSGTCTASQGGTSGVFYVLNQQTKEIVAYSIVSSKLTRIGSPSVLSAAPYSIAIAPGGGFLYVGTAAGIFLFNIGSNGALTLANGSNVISQDVATTMQVDSTGSWLLEAGPNLAELLAIHVNSATGVPTSNVELFTQLPAATVQQLAISPDNTHVFVALGNAGTEDVIFAAGNSAPFGTTANLAVVNKAGGAVSVAVDPNNRLVYVGETAALSGTSSGGLRVIDYNTLQEVSGSPFATGGTAPYAIAPTQFGGNPGNYVFVANRTVSGSSKGSIAAYAVTTSGTTTTLTALGSTIAAGITPVGLTQDNTGNYLLVVSSGGSPDLTAYTMSSGTLTSALTSATGSDPVQASAIAAAR